MKLKVGLLGGGSWGTTVASLTAKNSSTIIWARNPKTVEEINEHHTNEKYLPNAKLTTSLKASNSIKAISFMKRVKLSVMTRKRGPQK